MPEEIWHRTPAQLLPAIQGAQARQEAQALARATHTHLLLSAWVENPPSVAAMMGWAGTPRDPAFVPEEVMEGFRKQVAARNAARAKARQQAESQPQPYIPSDPPVEAKEDPGHASH